MGLAADRRGTVEGGDALPADRLLVFDVAEGWDPLCAFLDVAAPDEPFSHHNLAADVSDVFGGEPA
jgi:hypothetical protein